MKRARIDQRLHFDSALFVRGLDIIKAVVFMGSAEVDQGKLDAIERGYQLLEVFLESGTYLVGDSLTVADLSCAALLESAKGITNFNEMK